MQGSSPNFGHPITVDVPSNFSLQSADSAEELWCGSIIPSPPSSPTVKSNTAAVSYGRQAKYQSDFSLDWCPGGTKQQTLQKDAVALDSKTDVGPQADVSTASVSEEAHDSASTTVLPTANHGIDSPSQPLTLALPKIQQRPNSAPALDLTTDRLSFSLPPRPSSSVASVGSDIPRLNEDPVNWTADLARETPNPVSSAQQKSSNVVSMTSVMALGTRQAIASPGSIHSVTSPVQNPHRFQMQMPPLGHPIQVNKDYDVMAANHNYHNAGGLGHGYFQTPNIQPPGIPFYVPPHGGIHVPQNFPGRVAQPASNVPGFPTFVPTPANYTQNWAVPGQNLGAVQQPLTVLPFPHIVYPNLQSHVNQMRVPQGQKIDAITSASTSMLRTSNDPFIIKDHSSFSMTKVPRGKRRRASVSTRSSSTPSLENSGSGCETGSSTATSVSASTSSVQKPLEPPAQTGPTFICRLDGCNARLSSVDKRSFNHHLILGHAFHGSGKRELMRCKWRDGEGDMCGKTLQMQSLVKHVCEKHFHSLGMSCTLCGSRQARADNIGRHLLVCKAFAKTEKSVQQRVWEDLVPGKPYGVFLSGREAKRRRVEE